jgi:hypothetical protein
MMEERVPASIRSAAGRLAGLRHEAIYCVQMLGVWGCYGARFMDARGIPLEDAAYVAVPA